jgi:uncharacterized protein DUF3574
MRAKPAVFILLLSLTLAGCGYRPVSLSPAALALSQGSEHPQKTRGWVESDLYFGIGPADQPGQGREAQWRAFLDEQVTPRFPSGLSVVDAYGQWHNQYAKAIERLHSKILIIAYPDTQENRDKIEAIRVAWKKQTGDQSVLRITVPVDVSF